MAEASGGPRPRPLSPHIGVWRWHVTMFTSIAHRATGVALYGGALLLALWAVCLASGPKTFELLLKILGSIPGQVVMFGLAVSAFYHLANGVRHLVWDFGKGFTPKVAERASVAGLAFGLVAAIAVFAVAYLGGGH